MKILLSQAQRVGDICRRIEVSEQRYYRWRREHSSLEIGQIRRLKDLVQRIIRLKRAVTDLTPDMLMLKEAAERNWQAPSAAVHACITSGRRILAPAPKAIWQHRMDPSGTMEWLQTDRRFRQAARSLY